MADANKAAGFLKRFTVLKGASRELWITFIAKFLMVAAYKITAVTIVLWLKSDFGYTDQNALHTVAFWSISMTVATLLVGSLTDAIGLRRTFILGAWVCVVSRAVMAFTTVKWLALACGLLPLAVGEALSTPVLVAAIRKYSTTEQRSFSFSIFYTIMNLGFLVVALLFDYIRQNMGEHGQITLPIIQTSLSTYRTIFLVGMGIELTVLPFLYFIRKGAEMTDTGLNITVEQPKYPGASMISSFFLTIRDAAKSTVTLFVGLLQQAGFYRLLAFLLLIAFLKLIFMQMDYVFPTFGIRELGDGAPVGTLSGLNNLLIVFLVPVIGALTQKLPAYRMVIVGGIISAVSVFIMALPMHYFQKVADGPVGHAIAGRWFGSYYRFSLDDFQDVQGFIKKLESRTNTAAVVVSDSLSEITRGLLAREASYQAALPRSDSRPASMLFKPEDLEPTFDKALTSGPPTQPVLQLIWQTFSENGRNALTNMSSGQSSPQLLAAELNTLLRDGSFRKNPVWDTVKLSDITRALMVIDPKRGTNALPNHLAVVNRMILEDVFETDLRRSNYPLRAALAADLSKLIKRDLLSENPAVTNVPLSALTKEHLAKTSPQPKASIAKSEVRLNRLLLEDAFPTELAQNRVGVQGSVNPYYIAIVVFVMLMSFGEAFYSPRVYEYAASIAPKGQEASYSALSYIPFLLAKLIVGTVSGSLLAQYCPEIGDRHSGYMWLVIALIASVAPVGLILLRGVIRMQEAGRGN